ncbi:MAG: hypothetical protein ACTSX6_11935 [Candidatus Heimdallarchaeaceae archaeon]
MSENSELFFNLLVAGFSLNELQPIIISKFLANQQIFDNQAMILKTEKLFSSYSPDDFFPRKPMQIESAEYKIWREKTDTISPSFYIFNKKKEKSSLLNVLATSPLELDLFSVSKEIEFILDSLEGIQKRLKLQKEEYQEEIVPDELKKYLEKLSKFYNWQLLEECSLFQGDKETISARITLTLLIKASILKNQIICSSCGKIHSEDSEICDCGGELRLFPLYLNLEEVSFVIPSSYREIFHETESLSPLIIFEPIKQSFLPLKLLDEFSKIPNIKFENSIFIPKRSYFRETSTNDVLEIIFDEFVENDENLYIFAYVLDTRLSSNELIPSTLLPVINNNLKSSFEICRNWKESIAKTELQSWKITPFVKIKFISNFSSIEDMFSLDQGGVENE